MEGGAGTRFVRVEFARFKAFNKFTLTLRHFNILVGPNNAGKSTVLAGFRILAAAMRRAGTRKSQLVRGPNGATPGYPVDLSAISIAEENLFYNYDDSEPATVRFKLSNGNELLLYFPEQGSCSLIADAQGRTNHTPATFKSQFNCRIGFVPILGPLEHNENLFEKEAARLALYNYRAARNFRNIWHHFPDKFDEFRTALIRTWPGMDVERPQIDTSHGKPRLHMFCPEHRIPREIFWAGFGFQVWCQMLTHIIQGKDTAIFLIDEPDIYLHSELQRQLIGLLRDMGPDILIATHSTEIVTEADSDEIILINKLKQHGKRIKRPDDLDEVFSILGSNLNPILTQLAKTRRVVFVEGQDFQIFSKFAHRLDNARVGNRSEFAVVSVDGFNPERIKNLKSGMETTLGGPVLAAAVLDKDYRGEKEQHWIERQCQRFCDLVRIHDCKEIENFLLVPNAIDRAAERKLHDQLRRGSAGRPTAFAPFAARLLDSFAEERKSYVQAQYLAFRRKFEQGISSSIHDATFNQETLVEFEQLWRVPEARLGIIPGKEALSAVNRYLQETYGINVTATAIIDAMLIGEAPAGIRQLVAELDSFALRHVVEAGRDDIQEGRRAPVPLHAAR